MSSIFGGSQQQQSSQYSNQAYPYLQQSLSGTVANGTGAGNQIANLLGLNGGTAQAGGFNNWKNSTGYNFGLNQGVQSIVGNQATQGLLNSGSTAKAVDTYGQNYANTQYGNYTNMLQQLLGSGIQGASAIGQAGQQGTSQGTTSSKGNAFTSIFGNQGI